MKTTTVLLVLSMICLFGIIIASWIGSLYVSIGMALGVMIFGIPYNLMSVNSFINSNLKDNL